MVFRSHYRAFTLLELLMTIVIIGILIALLLPAVQSSRESARRLSCVNNLMQIGLAAKGYEEVNGVLPPGSTNPTGPIRNVPIGEHFSWITRLLPYMEKTPLYEQLDFSKSIYSETNQPVWVGHLDRWPFVCPSDGGGYNNEIIKNISYMACQGGKETPIDTDNNGVFFLNSKLRSRDIPDGTSNTIFFGESILFWGTSRNNSSSNTFSRSSKSPLTFRSRRVVLPTEGEGPFHLCTLGWATGTPATLRNTGNPVNVITGPFAIDNKVEELFKDNDLSFSREERDQKTPFTPIVINENLWQEQHPAQFLVGGFSSFHVGGANFFMGDGSQRLISNSIDLEVYRALGNRHDSKENDLP